MYYNFSHFVLTFAILIRSCSGANDTCASNQCDTDSPLYDLYQVEFQVPGKLGIRFEKQVEHVHVAEVLAGGQAHALQTISLGDEAIAVNDKSLQGLSLSHAVKLIQEATNPKVIQFRRERKRRHVSGPSANHTPKAETNIPRHVARANTATVQTYKVEFRNSGPLGISLLSDLVVQEIVHGSLASKSGVIEQGDTLVSVNGSPMFSHGKQILDVDSVISRITSAPLPRTLEFKPHSRSPTRTSFTQVGAPKPVSKNPVAPTATKTTSHEEPGTAGFTILEPTILSGKKTSGLAALFGSPMGCTRGRLVTGVEVSRKTLSTGCTPWKQNPDGGESVRGSIVLLKRGACSFATKAQHVEAAGGIGLVIVNSAGEKLIRMPAGAHELAKKQVRIPVMMIDNHSGMSLHGLVNAVDMHVILAGGDESLEDECAVASDSEGSNVVHQHDHPAGMEDWSTEHLPNNRTRQRRKVSNTITLLTWASDGTPGGSMYNFFGYRALFGPQIEVDSAPTGLVLAEGNHEACEPLASDAHSYAGAMVVVKRGTCVFSTKALNVQRAGGFGMVVVNNEPGTSQLYEMPGNPDEEPLVKIPSIMITPQAFELLEASLTSPNESVLGKLTVKHEFFWCDLRTKHICGL